jgi:DeoR/GlpR family transcriptional regulator of sugar metabolism
VELAKERQAIALQRLNNAGYLQVVDHARSLAVCQATVRRDLEHSQRLGLLSLWGITVTSLWAPTIYGFNPQSVGSPH